MKPSIKVTADKLTPAERRRLRVRDRILDAAEEVFAKEGSSGLSIRRLAASVDYSPAAIYKYFDSKEALVDHLRDTFIDRMNEKLIGACDADLPIIDRTVNGLRAYITTAVESPHHYEAVWGHYESETPAAQNAFAGADWKTFHKTDHGKGFGALVGLVKEGQQSGTYLKDNSVEEYAKILWAGAHGIALMLMHGPEVEPNQSDGLAAITETSIKNYANMIVRGICVKLN